jgi:tetratricopeptide (TPR) repeat protein
MGSLWGPPPDEEANARSFADAVAAFRATGPTPAGATSAAAPAPKEDGGWREQMKRANAARDQRAAAAAEAGAPAPKAAASSVGWRDQMRVANAARDQRAQQLRKQQEPEPEPLPADTATNAALAAFLSRVAPAVADQLTANLCDAGDFGLGLASAQPAVSSCGTVADCRAAAEAAFAAGAWTDAVAQLTTALRIAAADALKTRQLNLELRAVLLSRRAECFLQQNRWKDAVDDAREALRIDPENAAYRTIEQKANAKFEQEEHPLPSQERTAGTDLPDKSSGPSVASGTSSGLGQFHQHLKPNVHVTVLVPGVGLGVQPGKHGVLSHQNDDGTWRVVYADGRTGDVEEVRLRRTRAGGRQLSDSSRSD